MLGDYQEGGNRNYLCAMLLLNIYLELIFIYNVLRLLRASWEVLDSPRKEVSGDLRKSGMLGYYKKHIWSLV